jgi:DNA-binding XRE family transcriptional regulator
VSDLSLKDARQALDITIDEMARACGVHRQTWVKWERGERAADAAYAAAYAAYATDALHKKQTARLRHFFLTGEIKQGIES